MHKLWICLTALAICLTVLPVPAEAGDRMHRYWRHHQSYHWRQYYRPHYWNSLTTDIIPIRIEVTATGITPG